MENKKLWSSKHFICIFLVGNFIFFSIVYLPSNTILRQNIVVINSTLVKERGLLAKTTSSGEILHFQPLPVSGNYLVFSPKCMIPNVDPWNEEIKPFYKKQPYIPCNKYALLTYVVKNETNAVLYVDTRVAKYYSTKRIRCCYMNVTRDANTKVPDNNIVLSNCTDFKTKLDITDRIVTVKCRAGKEIYSNAHAPVTINQRVREKMEAHGNLTNSTGTIRPLSILFIGIDSISRLNFIRTMPRTREFLLDTGWIEYTGYNKIGDNTFPNLVAILTGKNSTNAYKTCNPTVIGKLDDCNFVWKDYRNFGYVTAYAEDESSINTFNYHKKGFLQEPTDYYFRAYSYAANKLTSKIVDDMFYCTGPESYGERILNVAKDFASTFKKYPNFGFFWMNSFSHNKLNSPTRMDVRVLQFFEDLLEDGVMDNTMIIFLSDHGLRFGKVRMTRTGWLEERLPFIYFWIPKWFQSKFPNEYSNLKTNANNQLTTPYDVYMTLQDVLKLSGFNYSVKASESCPSCKSFFDEIQPRSCEEVSIDVHWCTCYGYKPVDKDEGYIKQAGQFIVEQINDIVGSYSEEGDKCAKYNVSKVLTANTSVKTSNTNNTYLLIILETIPEAVFETTISVTDGNFIKGNYISRLDRYSDHSGCVDDSNLKLYCYCSE